MVIYRQGKNHLLMPMFLGILLLTIFATPINNFFEYRRTNTDTRPSPAAPARLEPLEAPAAQEISELAAPRGVAAAPVVNTTVVAGAYKEVASTCANTPTPGVNQLSLCGRIVPLSFHSGQTAGVSPGAGLALKQSGYNFIFGHNSSNVFGGVHALLLQGDPLIVNIGGVEQTYQFVYYRQNASTAIIDREFLPAEGSSVMALMTCAPWVVDGSGDPSRFGFIFSK